MEEQLRGIILYTIERDGNLNGIYTNNLIPNARIFTETARRRFNDPTNSENNRRYDFFYFDTDNNQQNGILTMRIDNNIFNVEWVFQGQTQPLFIGQGFQMNDLQIAISYWVNA